MTISKKISLIVASFLLVLAGLIFASCGSKNYSNVTISNSVSDSSLSLFVGETTSVTFTVENPVSGMNTTLSYALSNSSICSVNVVASARNSTTYEISGIRGGTTNFEVQTIEGHKTASIDIYVRAYSNNLMPAEHSLYLTQSTPLQPSSYDFVFSADTTEKELSYYFFGQTEEAGSLVLGDVQQDGEFINEFTSISLTSSPENDQYYLIFEDSLGQLFTLGSASLVGSTVPELINTKYALLPVTMENGNYVFDSEQATAVQAGDTFAFIALYDSNSQDPIYCAREFSVLLDIDYGSIYHTYGYRIEDRNYTIGSDNLYIFEQNSHSNITLIPNYTMEISDNPLLVGETINFITVYLEVVFPTTSDLINETSFSSDTNIITSVKLGQIVDNSDGTTSYFYEINCANGSSNSQTFNVHFYYDGFENSEDQNVNFTYSIPVNIRVIPTSLLVNNVDLGVIDTTYTFYNEYAGDMYGWQEFYFNSVPQNAEISYLAVDLTESDLQLMYQNRVYTDGTVQISDLRYPIYLKGADEAQLTEGVEELPLSLHFNIIEEDSIEIGLKYQIIQGAELLDFATDAYEERIYLNLNQQRYVEFTDIFADAIFNSFSVTFNSGVDVARFQINIDQPYIEQSDRYHLNMALMPTSLGTGTYTVAIDNGRQIALTINVDHSLDTITVETNNTTNTIRNTIIDTENNTTKFYAYNGQNNYFDVSVIANNDSNSTAIKTLRFNVETNVINIDNVTNNNKNFNINLIQNGTGIVNLTMTGYDIEDFERTPKTITHKISVVSFSYIDRLNVYKESDGLGVYKDENSTSSIISQYGVSAAYANVYTNTTSQNARKAVFHVVPANEDAYLFAEPSTLQNPSISYTEDYFDQAYVYWEANATIYLDNRQCNQMYYDPSSTNIYNITNAGTFMGTFDTSTNTFLASSTSDAGSTLILTCHVRQYGWVYSYTINITITQYIDVERVESQEIVDTFEFSSLRQEHSVVAYASNQNATNKELVALVSGAQITVGEETVSLLNYEDGVEIINSDNRYSFTFKANPHFIELAENYDEEISGTIIIAAAGWVDSGNNLMSNYQNSVVRITVRYANGTPDNRFTLESAEDVANIKQNLSAHYQIKTTIDISSITDQLPLGKFSGSIIGVGEYAKITGISVQTPFTDGDDAYYGLFTTLDVASLIEYVEFEGSISINQADSAENYIGLVAGQNQGTLLNVGVILNESNISVKSRTYFGGVVGQNNGNIVQDYTLFENVEDEDEESAKTLTGDYILNSTLQSGENTGRLDYTGMTPKILVYMNGTINVQSRATSAEAYVGGAVGYQTEDALVRKIDSQILQTAGYTNYTAYSLMDIRKTATGATVYAGGLVGYSDGGTVHAGYNQVTIIGNTSSINFVSYSDYEGYNNGNYSAGKGIIVGGQISSHDYVGGIIGHVVTCDNLSGLTSRVFVRGQLFNSGSTYTEAQVAGIANVAAGANLSTAFAMQAIDQGRIGSDSSMIILYASSAYSNQYDTLTMLTQVAFGILATGTVMQAEGSYINSLSYLLSREQAIKGDDDLLVNSSTRSTYYGDFVVLSSDSDGNQMVQAQQFFYLDEDGQLSVSGKFDNCLTGGDKQVFFMYYFDAADGEQTQNAQILLDEYLNRVSITSKLYPFVASGEMSFVSRNGNILSIDQSGRITVNGTGLAVINASSILNNTNAIDIYIYVINYFNAEYQGSIIYPNGSTSAQPIDETVIQLRGNNTATLYVIPNYSLSMDFNSVEEGESEYNSALQFVSDSNGGVSFRNITFELEDNREVTAKIDNIQRDKIEGVNAETEGKINASAELDIEISGNIINIRRNESTQTSVYSLVITPILQRTIDDEEYIKELKKKIENTTIDYKKGAQSINNIKYDQTPIISSQKINETVIVNSDAREEELYYYIIGLDGQLLQGSEALESLSGFNLTYQLEEGDYLFTVSGLNENTYSAGTPIKGFTDQKFEMEISINKESSLFAERYQTNIYGRYQIVIIASSNTSQITSFYINFDQTNITSIVVSNYPNVNEADGVISSSSIFARPGNTGLLAITVTPEDGDFDYILVENAENNYNQGFSVANFTFAARNNSTDGEGGLFDADTIRGETTSRGIRISLEEILSCYNNTEENFVSYNGVIYILYEMSSLNVVNNSISNIVITLMKDGQELKSTTIPLTIQLQNFVTVEIDGKEPITTGTNYHAVYNVARGLRYRLNIDSYGFMQQNITLLSGNENLGTIVPENGQYYLQITNNSISYTSSQNIFDLIISAEQYDGETLQTASSRTQIQIKEYVINYNGETASGSEDIIAGMGDGVINLQVGSQMTLQADVYDYIEYNAENTQVVESINNFIQQLSINGTWMVYTNLINETQPDYGEADRPGNVTHLTYQLGYNGSDPRSGSNYFFNYTGLNFTPVRTHTPQDGFYRIYFSSSYESFGGSYRVTNNSTNQQNTFRTSFVFNVYTASSNESPIPIYDYEDFINMQQGGYYILLNDITLPSVSDEATGQEAYVPTTATFKSLDGNGHSIIFSGRYDMGALTNIGIFTILPEETIVKNLNVVFSATQDGSDLNLDITDDRYELYGLRTVKFVTSANTFNFGAIAGDNRGIITNCKISTAIVNASEYYIAVIADNSLTGSNVGGVAGLNSGYITNCQVSVNIKTPFRVGGIVGTNSGKIAASSFREGKIINNSNQNQYAAGFAYANLESGQIITSYVAGSPSNDILFTRDRNSYISSNEQGAGFVYQNLGIISDCYTDIYLGQTPHMAGFVYENGGQISNSFSVSVLSNENAAAAGFAYTNVIQTDGGGASSTGTFKNCYYFYNEQDQGELPSEVDVDINTSLQERDFEGVQRLTASQFADVATYFADYSYLNTIGYNSVWFVSNGNTSSTFVNYVPTTSKIEIEGEDGNIQTNTVYNTELQTLVSGRLELVSANIDVLSIRNFVNSEVDQSTGNITYNYHYDSNCPNDGTLHNPRTIYDSQTMETEILNHNANNNINTTYYRIISDISYAEQNSSRLYNTIFAGVIEGNGMEITQISLLSGERLTSAGLFAQVGYSASRTGSIKNLTISPVEVTFSNTNNVGTIAGVLRYGYLYDIDINSNTSNNGSSVVYGMNFVGGVVGRAINSYVIKNVNSDINTTASYMSSAGNRYTESSLTNSIYSYSGGVVGFAGRGTITNAFVSGVTSVMGGRAGLAYGGVGQGANINYTFVDLNSGLSATTIRAYHYGGFVAGEVAGGLNYSYAYSQTPTTILSPFTTENIVPSAVGGIAGALVGGGTIQGAVVDQSFRVTNTGDASLGILYVGGIVGMAVENGSYIATIKQAITNSQKIIGGSVLGGTVGIVSSSIELDEIAVKSQNLSVVGQKANPFLGGIIGQVSSISNSYIELTNSYCLADLEINTLTFGIASTANVGGLIASAINNATIQYCYTTSKINATIVDSRELGSAQEFNTFDSRNVSYTYRITTDSDEAGSGSASDTSASNVNIKDVYFIGSNSEAAGEESKQPTEGENNGTGYNNNFVSYYSKSRNVSMHLVVNNIGQSSLEYSENYAEDQTSDTVSVGVNKSTFFNLFGNKYYNNDTELFYNNVRDGFVYNVDGSNITLGYDSSNGTYRHTQQLDGEPTSFSSSNGNMLIYYRLSNNQIVYANSSGDLYTTIKLVLYNNGLSFDYDNLYDNPASGDNSDDATDPWEGASMVRVLLTDYSVINNITTYYNSTVMTGSKYKYVINNYTYDSLEFNINPDSGLITLGALSEGVENTLTWDLIPSINHSTFIQSILLKDSQGTYYEQILDTNGNMAYQNVETERIYTQNQDGSWGIEVPTQHVWITNVNGFSILSFENNMEWLGKAE